MKFSFSQNMVFIFTGAILLGLVIGILTMFIGRKFCGYACPLGTLQEGLFKLRGKKYRLWKMIPFFYENRFNKVIYAVLIITFVLVLIRKSPLYMNLCPILTIGSIPYLIIPGLILFAIIVAGSLLIDRFWCRFLCPYAALLNLFQKLSGLFGFKRLIIKRNLEKCIDCCNCIRHCPMNINMQLNEYISDINCIHCLKCIEACPKDGTITENMTERNCYE